MVYIYKEQQSYLHCQLRIATNQSSDLELFRINIVSTIGVKIINIG